MTEEKKELEYGDLLEYTGYLQDSIKKFITHECESDFKIMNLEETVKQHAEFINWIKEAFGHCINEDYFSYPLSEHIGFYFTELEKNIIK